jgi:peptide/nickel transport system permease protein
MGPFVLRRVLSSILLVWGVVTVTFFLAHLAPGDPVELLSDPTMRAEDIEVLRARYGLDAPLPVQYVRWLGALISGDLGASLVSQRPVADILAEAIPNTLRLTILALLLHFTVGTLLAMAMATRPGRRWTMAGDTVSLVLYSLPAFWLGVMLQFVFAYQLRWLPSGGLPAGAATGMGALVEEARHLALPVFVLGLSGVASVARTLRASIVQVLAEDYIRTARAKGLPRRTIFWKHAFRPASVTLITMVGLGLPFLLGGAVATEVIFAWPGMGRVAVEAILTRDYPLILATTAMAAVLVVLGNLLADIGYAWVDPRQRRTS